MSILKHTAIEPLAHDFNDVTEVHLFTSHYPTARENTSWFLRLNLDPYDKLHILSAGVASSVQERSLLQWAQVCWIFQKSISRSSHYFMFKADLGGILPTVLICLQHAQITLSGMAVYIPCQPSQYVINIMSW
jgi:hypothetical protein